MLTSDKYICEPLLGDIYKGKLSFNMFADFLLNFFLNFRWALKSPAGVKLELGDIHMQIGSCGKGS